MKKRIAALLMVAAVCIPVLAGCASQPDSAGTQLVTVAGEPAQVRTITVSAQGTVSAQPDVAYVVVGITTQDKDMKKAQSANGEVMNAVSSALTSAGLAEDDIRTVQYNAYPLYRYSDGSNKITGYEVNNQVELTIREIDRVGEYIDLAVAGGANMANAIRFGLLDEQALYNEALELAVHAARAKAGTLATAGGVKLTGTVQLTENTSGGQVYRSEPYAALDDTTASTPISAGSLDVDAGVTVVYEIE